ncbi:MAG: vanadium-dependent haloperoxidase [Phycisphaerales bacterium]|nr:vanadium-dependent haloperoxidase [Phycisphaerales bacterium]
MFRTHTAIAVAALAGLPSLVRADVVTDWNDVLLNAIKAESVPPPRASRAMAIMSTAVFDTLNSFDQQYLPYRLQNAVPLGADRRAAAAAAAHRVLSQLFPGQQAAFDTALAGSLSGVPGGSSNPGVAMGRSIGDNFYWNRVSDGASTAQTPYTPGSNPGDYNPGAATALLPGWGNVHCFSMNSGSQFRRSGPPALTSQAYTDAFNDVKSLGRATGSSRTPDQTNIALFWAANAGTVTPPGMWVQIASQIGQARGQSDMQNARMFAILGASLADAAITSWDMKYTFNSWRPIAAIRGADTDGNPDTLADAAWSPLIPTPPHPDYTSGHSTFSAAAARALGLFFGTDTVSFGLTSRYTFPDTSFVDITRSFTSLQAAAEEAGRSRIYGGIHFQYANEAGLASGADVGDWTYGHYFQPVPAPAAISGVLAGLVMLGGRRRR